MSPSEIISCPQRKLLETARCSVRPLSPNITVTLTLPSGRESVVVCPSELYIRMSLSDQDISAMTLSVLGSRALMDFSSSSSHAASWRLSASDHAFFMAYSCAGTGAGAWMPKEPLRPEMERAARTASMSEA